MVELMGEIFSVSPKLTVPVEGVRVPRLFTRVKAPARFIVPAPLNTIWLCAAYSALKIRLPPTVSVPVEMVMELIRLLLPADAV